MQSFNKKLTPLLLISQIILINNSVQRNDYNGPFSLEIGKLTVSEKIKLKNKAATENNNNTSHSTKLNASIVDHELTTSN